MEFKVHGVTVALNPAELEDSQLSSLAEEVMTAATERGLEIPFATGAVAVEGAMKAPAEPERSTLYVKELLGMQLTSAGRGYSSVVRSLNMSRHKSEQVSCVGAETLHAELDAWLTDEKVAYVARAQEADPDLQFTLVATPNVIVDSKVLISIAKDFGRKHEYGSQLRGMFYSRYTPQQLSGTDPTNGKAVMFSLIPSKYTPDMHGIVQEQRDKLAGLHANTPYLKVPSPMEAVTYWHVLREHVGGLGSEVLRNTDIRHFNLPEKYFYEIQPYVPSTSVTLSGWGSLSMSGILDYRQARLAVG